MYPPPRRPSDCTLSPATRQGRTSCNRTPRRTRKIDTQGGYSGHAGCQVAIDGIVRPARYCIAEQAFDFELWYGRLNEVAVLEAPYSGSRPKADSAFR